MPTLPPEALAGWSLLTRLGEAQILLPAMLAASLCLRRAALPWLAATAVAALLTTATKVAFFGWELGYAPLNYTGISGHAMFSAAVLPVLFGVLAVGCSRSVRLLAVALGVALAVLVAVSRVAVSAHSVVESALGCTLGLAAAAVALRRPAPPLPGRTLGLLAPALAGWLLLMPLQAPPSRTHDGVQRLALTLSGRERPYARWMMLRDHRLALQRQGLQTKVPGPWPRRAHMN